MLDIQNVYVHLIPVEISTTGILKRTHPKAYLHGKEVKYDLTYLTISGFMWANRHLGGVAAGQ